MKYRLPLTLGAALIAVLVLTLVVAVAQDELPEGFNEATVEAAVQEFFAATATTEAEAAAAKDAMLADALPATATVQAAFDAAVEATAEARVQDAIYSAIVLETPPDMDLSSYHHTADGDPALGAEDALVTITEYSDFSCGYCRRFFTETLPSLLEIYDGKVQFVYRDFPVLGSTQAALAAECADEQGLFWEYHNYLFANSAKDEMTFMTIAYQLGMDLDAFGTCMASEEIMEEVTVDAEDAQALGFSGTPSFSINAQTLVGAHPLETFQEVIDLEMGYATGEIVPTPTLDLPQPVLVPLDEMMQWDAAPEMSIDPNKKYYARFVTGRGDILIELFADQAPLTVNNFVFLAREGFYDNTSFHRVIDEFVAQGGDPSGTGMGGPGYAFDDEVDNGLSFDEAGLLAMANSGPNTNGSQFFITYAPLPYLDGSHTIFGKVIEGFEIAESLTRRDPQNNPAFLGDALLTVEIVEE